MNTNNPQTGAALPMFGLAAPNSTIDSGVGAGHPVLATGRPTFGATSSTPFGGSTTFGVPSNTTFGNSTFGSPAGTALGSPANTAFGVSASTTLGAPVSTTFGVPASTTFGVPASTTFGVPASTTLGAPASTPFGVPSGTTLGTPASTTFGATCSTTLGAQPGTSFGVPAGTAFSAAATTSLGAPASTTFRAPTSSTFGSTVGATIDNSSGGFSSLAQFRTENSAPASSATQPTSIIGSTLSTPPVHSLLPAASSASVTSTISGSAFNATTTATPGFSLSLPPTTTTPFSTSASTLRLGTSTGAFPQTSAAAPVSAATSLSNVLTSEAGATNSISFAQLDDTIQKWTLELVELERVFLNQMDQVRDWDRLLLSTGDKIVSLNDSMQKVTLRQQQLDHELDFIVAQQRELVECLLPLEKEFEGITVSDPERNSVYQRAENLNTQLQQISEDLKGVIEHINERNKTQDTSDPIVQIGRILNAHMNSLQWVDQNTAVIQQMLDQVGKMRDIHRRDADSTQNL